MTEPSYDSAAGRGLTGYRQPGSTARRPESANLADILERVLDKGIVIAGDIQVNLLDIELLTIKLRLVIASVDRAKEMGIDWWEHDPTLSSRSAQAEVEAENRRLRERVAALEGDPAEDDERRLREDRRERRAVSRPGRADRPADLYDLPDDLPDDRRDRRERRNDRRDDQRSRRPPERYERD